MEEGGRRVKLDLSDFVLDVGSHRWLLLVPGAMVTVGDLLTRLRGEYEQVEEGDGLTVFLDGQYMVPPWEPLAILREGDLLRITLSKASRAGRPPAAKRRRVEEVQAKGASKRTKVEQAKAKVEEVVKSKAKKKESSSSSSDSSSEEEATKTEVKKNEIKKVAAKKPVAAKVSSSSSSSSSEDEEETKTKQKPVVAKTAAKESSSSSSSEEEPSTVKPEQQVKAVSKESSSSDSSSSEEEQVKSAEVKQVEQPKAAKASSSSDSSEEESAKAEKSQPKIPAGEAGAGPAPGPPKRKRKRKPRNRNKLPADQMPDFGPPIQALPEFVAKPETSLKNMHRRFGEEGEAGEEEEGMEEGEELSAAAMQELYRQSVAYASRAATAPEATNPTHQPPQVQPTPAQPSPKPAQPSPKAAQSSPKPPAKQTQPKPIQPSTNGVTCEEALLAAQDQRATTNTSSASRAQPRVVFRPRALDVSKIRPEQPSPGLQLSTLGTEAARASLPATPARGERDVKENGVENGKEAAKVEGMEALLGCRGKVFNRSIDRPGSRDYSSLTPLQGTPDVGAVLAYRVMELGADYTPGMSQYKEAKVVQVAGEQVTLELQAGASTRVGGRFSMVEEEVEVERVVTLSLGELITPLLVT